MAKGKLADIQPVCGRCVWFDVQWQGSTCKSEGVGEDGAPCPKYEEPIRLTDYRNLPVMQRARKALQSADGYNVPLGYNKELKAALTSSKKDYLPKSTDNIMLAKRLADRMAQLQAHRDRTIALLDDISHARSRVKALCDETRSELSGLRDVAAQSTVKARDQMVDEIMRPLLKRYEHLSNMKELATSVMYNIKSGLDVCEQIAQLHQMHMRLK